MWDRAGALNARFLHVLGGRIVASAATVTSGLILLHLLPKRIAREEWAVVVVALQVLAYLSFLDGGFRTLLNREMLRTTDAGERADLARIGQILGTGLTLACLLFGPLLTLAYSLSPSAQLAHLGWGFYAVMGISGGLTFWSGMQLQALVGVDRQGMMSAIQGLGSLVNLGIVLCGLELQGGAWAFAIAQAVQALVQGCVASVALKAVLPGVRLLDCSWPASCRQFVARHWQQAWSVFRMQFVIFLLLSLDVLLAGLLLGEGSELVGLVMVARIATLGRGGVSSFGEALWPRIARGEGSATDLTGRVLAVNAWLFGIAAGLLAGAAPAVLGWFVAKSWTASPLLTGLLAARFLVIGVSSPASYHLIGAGRYPILVRAVSHEVLAAVVLGLAGGWLWGAPGLAAGFLLATGFGTFYVLFAAYASIEGHTAPVRRFAAVWGRALIGAAAAGGVSAFLIANGWTGVASLGAAAAGFLVALALAVALAWLRSPRAIPWKSRLWNGI
jgi:O-antigen/teichoic acid export membrane protein